MLQYLSTEEKEKLTRGWAGDPFSPIFGRVNWDEIAESGWEAAWPDGQPDDDDENEDADEAEEEADD